VLVLEEEDDDVEVEVPLEELEVEPLDVAPPVPAAVAESPWDPHATSAPPAKKSADTPRTGTSNATRGKDVALRERCITTVYGVW
jgi:hypothetical protein